ncbi:unnamed protein product, partial [Musa acuminata subsp. burmannicoides]
VALLFAGGNNPPILFSSPLPETLIPYSIDHRSLSSPPFYLTHSVLSFLCATAVSCPRPRGPLLHCLRSISGPRHSSAEGPESHRRRICGVAV